MNISAKNVAGSLRLCVPWGVRMHPSRVNSAKVCKPIEFFPLAMHTVFTNPLPTRAGAAVVPVGPVQIAADK